jgi:PD-(D/E)XK nuclease superfamily
MTIQYSHHSPSSLNLFAAAPAMWVLEKVVGLKQPVGAPAHRGTAVEHGIALGLLDPTASVQACLDAALTKYDAVSALSGDERREEYRDSIHDFVPKLLKELRPYGVPTRTQGFVEWQPEGLRLPVVGYFDFEWAQHGIIVDLKTTSKMPSSIKIGHARQIALYAPSDNWDARLTYCTPKKCATYRLENVREHRQALHQIALRVERFLALSDDPEFFKSITAPDLDSFYWSGPAARQLAYEHWKI